MLDADFHGLENGFAFFTGAVCSDRASAVCSVSLLEIHSASRFTFITFPHRGGGAWGVVSWVGTLLPMLPYGVVCN